MSNYEISTVLGKQYHSDVANDSTVQETVWSVHSIVLIHMA